MYIDTACVAMYIHNDLGTRLNWLKQIIVTIKDKSLLINLIMQFIPIIMPVVSREVTFVKDEWLNMFS